MSVIHILPDAVANKIAAGEVVERPASVVKELVENSLDAGARRVEVAVEAGGKRLIRIEDDGCGMSHDDALLAFERHATSKIRSAEDLFEVTTLGFRGEALPSIAAVSRVVLETRDRAEPAGTRVEIAGGKLHDVKEIAWPGGTRIEVRDLFFNTPARRKFLKSESTELGHIATVCTHYALAHPDKSFRLASLSNELLNAAPVADLRARVYQVMGGQTLDQLIEMRPVERRIPPPAGAEQEEQTAPSGVRVHGLVSRPEVQRLNRNHIYFFVNRRLVRDRLLLHAVTEAYRNVLPAGMFPVALVFLELPPAEVDVNVHPAKTEVRFRHSAFVHEVTRDAIRQALIASRPVAAFPLGRRHVEAAAVQEEAEASERLSEEPPPFGSPQAPRPSAPAESPRRFQLTPSSPSARPGILRFEDGSPVGGALHPDPRIPPGERACGKATSLAADQAAFAEAAGLEARPGRDEFPRDLRALGQVHDSFIVATNAEGLWIIDQHVAHERVLFERHLRQRQEHQVEGQRLLLPIVTELRPEQRAAFSEIAEELQANGFEVEPLGQRTVAIQTMPAGVPAEEAEQLLVEILDGAAAELRTLSLDTLRRKIGASVACHAAIKINMPLDQSKMEWLLRALSLTQYPMACPHGRPIVLRYSLKEIQKAFQRI
jgi:DNA mismatch repair protein MutL